MEKKYPPQTFVGIPAGKKFRRGDEDGELKSNGEFPVAIPSGQAVRGKGRAAGIPSRAEPCRVHVVTSPWHGTARRKWARERAAL
jgi:hypothetical protein